MGYFINSREPQYVAPVFYAVQILPDGNVISFRVNNFDREDFGENYIGIGLRTHKAGKYTVMFSHRAKSCGKPMNYLASRFTRIKIYGDAFVVKETVFGTPLLFTAKEAQECSEVLESVFVRKRRM